MKKFLKKAGLATILPISIALSAPAVQADTIRIALGETPSDELAAFFIALDRAKADGLDYEWTAFSDEELAIQAVLSGQMEIGFGTPYAAMQRAKAPVRIIFQLSKLKFFPVTTMKYSKLEDLDGEPILLHSRGGGTDSIANVIESETGIKFGKRSYVPGSANRVVALVAGQADATIIDLSNKNKVMRQHGDKFNVLPMFDVEASDEALFANLDWIKANEDQVQIFVDALLSVWQEMNADRQWSGGRQIRKVRSVNCPRKSLTVSTISMPTQSRAGFTTRTAAAGKQRWPTWSGTAMRASSKAIHQPSRSRTSGTWRRWTLP